MIADPRLNISAVLMPSEVHASFFAFHDVLVVVQKRRFSQRCSTDRRHQVAEQEFAQLRMVPIALTDEIPPPAVIDPQGIDAFTIHLGVHLGEGRFAHLA